jgi:hypothetical protein
VRARLYILATGLLLTNEARPRGLGNGNALVGDYFMERLTARGGVFIPTDPNLAQ